MFWEEKNCWGMIELSYGYKDKYLEELDTVSVQSPGYGNNGLSFSVCDLPCNVFWANLTELGMSPYY